MQLTINDSIKWTKQKKKQIHSMFLFTKALQLSRIHMMLNSVFVCFILWHKISPRLAKIHYIEQASWNSQFRSCCPQTCHITSGPASPVQAMKPASIQSSMNPWQPSLDYQTTENCWQTLNLQMLLKWIETQEQNILFMSRPHCLASRKLCCDPGSSPRKLPKYFCNFILI